MHFSRLTASFAGLALSGAALAAKPVHKPAAKPEPVSATPQVEIKTSMGDIVVELNHDKAPLTVDNFLAYVRSGFYKGTIFHRVIDGFMIQGGGFDEKLNQKPTRAPIPIESNNGLSNAPYTIAMARMGSPNSANSQFFINVNNNTGLDYPGQDGYGYTVFGKVVSGMDTIDKIAALPTGPGGPFGSDVPKTQVVITSATIVK